MNIEAMTMTDDSAPLRLEALRLLSIHCARLQRLRKATAKQWGDAVKAAQKHLSETLEDDVPDDPDEAREHLTEAVEAYQDLQETIDRKKGELEILDAQISKLEASSQRILHASHDPNDPQQGLDLDDVEAPMAWLTTDDIAQIRASMEDGRQQGMAPNPVMEQLAQRLREIAKDRN